MTKKEYDNLECEYYCPQSMQEYVSKVDDYIEDIVYDNKRLAEFINHIGVPYDVVTDMIVEGSKDNWEQVSRKYIHDFDE